MLEGKTLFIYTFRREQHKEKVLLPQMTLTEDDRSSLHQVDDSPKSLSSFIRYCSMSLCHRILLSQTVIKFN